MNSKPTRPVNLDNREQLLNLEFLSVATSLLCAQMKAQSHFHAPSQTDKISSVLHSKPVVELEPVSDALITIGMS
jgi:hypothetical protein